MWWNLLGKPAITTANAISSSNNNEAKKRTSIASFARDFEIYGNNYDMWSYPNIDSVKRNKICRQHQLPEGTAIYYFREYCDDWTLAVSEIGLSNWYYDDDINNHDVSSITWEEIKNVEYDRECDVFYIYDFNDDKPYKCDRYVVIKGNDNRNKFARILKEIATFVQSKERIFFSQIDNLMTNKEYNKVIELGENLNNKNISDRLKEFNYKAIAIAYNQIALQTENKETANNYRNKGLQYINQSLALNYDKSTLLYKADILEHIGQLYGARKILIDLMSDKDGDLSENYYNAYTRVTDIYANIGFTNINPYDRECIMFVKNSQAIAGCNDEQENIKNVFSVDAYPRDLIFPFGHPKANTLYMMHPIKHTHYYPCESIEDTLFLDKVREFTYLAQCLGATKVSFKAIKGEICNSTNENSSNISAEVGRKMAKADISINKNKQETNNSEKNASREWEYTFNPINMPYCPEDSIWLNTDTSWQQMVKMRLNGNQLSFTERITSKEVVSMSSNQQRDIEASFSTLLWKVSGKIGKKSHISIFKSEESEYEINVTFKPLNEYQKIETNNINTSSNNDNLTPNEERYKEEIIFYLEDDNQITPDERIMLERKRTKLGISEERALEIEKMCTPTLSEAEQEYLDIYKELCADGEITDRRRRMLDRERDSLGIPEQRAKELEAL